MKNFDKYFDLLNEKPVKDMNEEERLLLEKELGNLSEFAETEKRIEAVFNHEDDGPSKVVKQKLDNAFERKFSTRNTRHNGIISLSAFEKSSPWKMMATAASVSIVLFLSIQMGFKGLDNPSHTSPYLADTMDKNLPDTNYWPTDTVQMPF